MMAMPRSAYERSKAVETIAWEEHPVARSLALQVLNETSAARRQAIGQALLDVLNGAAGLPPCGLTVADRPQKHRKREGRLELKTYGYYRCDWEHGEARRGTIRIYNLTAIRQQILSPKVFLETLLHEWVHHYDFAGLRLERSPHTSGFFARIRAVAETLGVGFVAPPKREASIGPLQPDVDMIRTAPDRLRPGGSDPPKWIRDQIAALFGRKDK
jgi:hypothetical protein